MPAGEPAAAEDAGSPEGDAALAIALLAADPGGLGGAWLRGPPGPQRDGWLDGLRAALPADAPWRRLPPDVPDSRLLGGLDLAATLRTGRAVAERGVLAAADGGAVVLALAERTAAGVTARLAGVMDRGSVDIQRDGLAMCWPARFALVALDEGIGDERAPPALCDRMAFTLALDDLPPRAVFDVPPASEVAAARARLASVTAAEDVVRALCATAMALGIASPRASLLALRAARAGAALAGRCTVSGEDAAVAARLVLAPRATREPAEQAESTASPEQPPDATPEDSDQAPTPPADVLEDLVLAAARAALPTALLASLAVAAREASRRGAAAEGRREGARREARRGRPIGVRAGRLHAGARLALIETLRAAAPWQRLRNGAAGTRRLRIRPEDIRIRRYRARPGTTTIFAVDASGSAALHRLAEAKGAVELLLAECYARRDRVALIAFRGRAAEVLLPPTHALARARRSLAALPGGGATPLAAALDAALAQVEAERREGRTPLLVLLTDGRANVARDGTTGRSAGEADALAAARGLAAARITTLLVDTAPRAQPFARTLAEAMRARYLALPQADANGLSDAVALARAA